MIVTSDSTAFIAISSDAKTGKLDRGEPRRRCGGTRGGPSARPSTTNTSTGIADRPEDAQRLANEDLDLEPGQLRQSTQHLRLPASVANGVAGQLQKDVLERRQRRAEFGHANPVLARGTR